MTFYFQVVVFPVTVFIVYFPLFGMGSKDFALEFYTRASSVKEEH